MQIAELNHVALLVRDVEASVRFYRDGLGLVPIARPAFPFPGAWFRLGVRQELHLIEGQAQIGPQDAPRHGHFALLVTDVDGTAKELRGRGVAFRDPIRRPDGARQIFLRDPDGHVIELCGELP